MLRNHSIAALALAAIAAPTAALAQDRQSASERHIEVTPYIEAAQVVVAQLSPGDDVATYSRLAAGVDASFAGRNNAGAVSLRYERQIGWSDNAPDGDVISGIARTSIGIIPQALTLEAGAFASRTNVSGNGSSFLSPITGSSGESQIYSAYAGPSVHAQSGDLEVEGHYRIGYTRVEEPDAIITAPGAERLDLFDDSVVHNAQLRVGSRPHDLLPIGVGVGAGWYQEDISNLDQRVRNRWVRGDVTVPVSPNVALLGGIGYEDVDVSSRDVLRDGGGLPIIGGDGRYVTDTSAPRTVGYDVEGLIWDVGVMWRPSRRTSFEAHVGRRYDSTSYYGTLSYAPNSRSNLSVSVYDNVAGFGGQLTDALALMPTNFLANRNVLSGDLGGCVDSLDGNNCLAGVLGSVRSSTFRARGVAASYGVQLGRLSAGIGGGYDRRKFIAAAGTILAAANGTIDENIWLAAFLNGRFDEKSGFGTNVYANWFESGDSLAGDSNGYGASAAYYRDLTERLTANAAVSIDGINSDAAVDDILEAAALVGLRYSF